ncbi:MAG: ABC transporter substrate-binding protein, partial [Gammaproteobacteria bacterium]|nr:ABC transporter substrate-binding protein [Gammaproteobacteria bacterium]
ALEGLNQASGKGMRLGLLAAFNEINEQGGVHGRRIELKTLDDGYEPEKTIANTLELIEDDNVFSLIGAVGTPTSRAAVPLAEAHKVPYIGPQTGAAFLRIDNPFVVNLRASYAQETEEMVAFLTQNGGTERIAILYQDDSFGRAGYMGARAAMERRGLELLSAGVYRRNSIDVRTAVLDIFESDPDAIIMIGSYQPSAEFIKWSRRIGMDVLFINISFVNSNALAESLGDEGSGVMVSQVVPLPSGDTPPVAQAYREAITAIDPDAKPEFISFEGYLVGRVAIEGLRHAGRELNRANFLRSIRSLEDVDIDGFSLNYVDDNQGSDEVFMTVLAEDGSFHAVESLADITLPWRK